MKSALPGLLIVVAAALAQGPAHAQSADLVLCDRVAADPADPDKPADAKGVADIATEAALRTTLLGARSVAYSRLGASGILFAKLIERLDIAADINARAEIIQQGFTAEKLVTGEADLAVQQISELKQISGIEVVGPIPYALQTPAVFSAGRMAATNKPAEADRLLRFLASPEVAPALRESGLAP